MKNLYYILSVFSILLISSCSVSREAGESQLDEAVVRQAIESRRFIVKLDRLYTYGGMMFLRPRANYIIVDGEKAIISTAYVGRQYDIRPIAGINMHGLTSDYRITGRESRGTYEISMKVGNQASSFDIYLTVGKTGSVSASVNSIRIESARYSGYIVPIGERPENSEPGELI
ncbi:MAG TPA: DUF4251 domain-containing protein [Bacteroidales bacterium]|jgi:hypothetical protein|nr:DUF4251 domain-containing protein [Bacteroidales bacterium]